MPLTPKAHAVGQPDRRGEITGTTLTCVVDVQPVDTMLLEQGDPKLLAEVATELQLGDAKITRWELSPFNTPYYSYDIDSENFESAVSPAWRLRLETTVPAAFTVPPWDLGVPIPITGVDRSWCSHRTPWDYSANKSIVIALDGPEPDLGFLKDLPVRSTETATYTGKRFTAGMVRASPGTIPLPDQKEALFDVVMACYRQAYVVHCMLSFPLLED
jgi:hypothetical protein